jgi:hypothetical protein
MGDIVWIYARSTTIHHSYGEIKHCGYFFMTVHNLRATNIHLRMIILTDKLNS